MDIIAAYREAGTYRGAVEIAGTTHKTVKRMIARQEAGGAVAAATARAWTRTGNGTGSRLLWPLTCLGVMRMDAAYYEELAGGCTAC